MHNDLSTQISDKFLKPERILQIFISILLLFILMYIANSLYETKSARAQTSSATCTTSSISDTIVVLDTSGSMGDVSVNNSRINVAKDAAKSFVQNLQSEANNRVGFVTYGTTSRLRSPLTTDSSSIQTSIDAVSTSGGTCIECAIVTANNELLAKNRSQAKKVVVLLSDGKANVRASGTSQLISPETSALNAAKKGNKDHDIIYYTIGVGSGVNASFMEEIATSTGGKYYNSPTAEELNSIYDEIHLEISSGGISGRVFHDENNNQIFDTNEASVSGRVVEIRTSPTGTPVSTITSNESGEYSFSKLCDGTYYVSQNLSGNLIQTLPDTPHYTLEILNGNSLLDVDFGSYEGVINLILSVGLPGIGNETGDNADPIRKVRQGSVDIINMQNEKVNDDDFNFTYSEASNSAEYTGIAELAGLTPGIYYVKVKLDNTIYQQLPGVHNLTAGDNTLDTVILTPGNLNDDNSLDMRDYSVYIGCYGEKECDKKVQADFNDDGSVDGKDYNILIRAFIHLSGD